MTRKEQILRMIEKLDDDVSYERVMYHLSVMKDIEAGLEEIERGEGIEHDEFFRQLQEEWRESRSSGRSRRGKTSVKSVNSSHGTSRGRRKTTRTE